jgi:hypothetical protein
LPDDRHPVAQNRTNLKQYFREADEMKSTMLRFVLSFIIANFVLYGGCSVVLAVEPSHPALKECKWAMLADESIGLAAWVQECDFGFRKIDFVFQENSLAIRYSDGGKPSPVIDVIDLLPYETVETGLRRFFFTHTDKTIAKRCVLGAYTGGKPAAGTKRYTFIPNAEYRRELKAKANPNEIGEPPCGEWGDGPDGVQYFEVWPKSTQRKVLFVREGQEEPLFDAMTLQLIAPTRHNE